MRKFIQFVKTFSPILLALIAVVGFYLFAREKHIIWFWSVVIAALILTLVVTKGPDLLRDIQRLKSFPTLLDQVATLGEQVTRLTEANRDAEIALISSWENGVREGRAQILGEQYASGTVPPTLALVSRFEDEITLVGNVGESEVHVGARYFVEEITTGRIFGVVQVVVHEKDHNIVYLRCVDPIVLKFWELTNDKVDSDDPSAPRGFQLKPFVADRSISTKEVTANETENQELEPEVHG